jgi:hypothetical protein
MLYFWLLERIMSSEKTDLKVLISEIEIISPPEINLAIESKDNDGAISYNVGSLYYFRLYKYPLPLDVSIFTTNGIISFYQAETEEITETINFTGETYTFLSKPFNSEFTKTVIGTIKNTDGEEIEVELIPEVGSKILTSSSKCYGVFEITYNTVYYLYKISSSASGKSIITASAIYLGEKLQATLQIEFETEIEHDCQGIRIEYGTLDVEFRKNLTIVYDPDLKDYVDLKLDIFFIIPIHIYGSEFRFVDITTTYGHPMYKRTVTTTIEEVLVSINGSISPSKYVSEIISQKIYAGNIGEVYPDQGNLLMSGCENISSAPDGSTNTVNGIAYGTGVLKIKYISKYLVYQLRIPENRILRDESRGITGITVVKDLSNLDCELIQSPISPTSSTSEEPDHPESPYWGFYVKDIVTTAPIPDVSVYINDTPVGITNSKGRLPINYSDLKGIIRNSNTIKTEAEGWLPAESDGLPNDKFSL